MGRQGYGTWCSEGIIHQHSFNNVTENSMEIRRMYIRNTEPSSYRINYGEEVGGGGMVSH